MPEFDSRRKLVLLSLLACVFQLSLPIIHLPGQQTMKSTESAKPSAHTPYQNARLLATPRGVHSGTPLSVVTATRASCIGIVWGKLNPLFILPYGGPLVHSDAKRSAQERTASALRRSVSDVDRSYPTLSGASPP